MARGSIIKRGRGYSIVYRTPERKQKWESGFEKRRQAEERLREVLGDIHDGTYREPKPILFATFAEQWLQDYGKVKLKPATYSEYESHLRNHLLPAFGQMDLRWVSRHRIQQHVAKKLDEGHLSSKSIRNILVPLHRMLYHAVQWGYLRHNPADGIEKPRQEHREMDYLTPEEFQRLLDAVDDSGHRTLFLTAVLTGLRQGELLGLQWGDLQGNQLRVRRTLYWSSRGDGHGTPRWILQSPKSHYARREVDLSPKVVRTLQAHRKARKVVHVDDDQLIFPSNTGGPMDPKNLVRRYFYPALRKAELRRIRFHDLRHTYAALQIKAGANPKYLQQQMGHASIQTTLDKYGHLYPDVQGEAAARLEAVAFGIREADSPRGVSSGKFTRS